ncbi:unnamed protein product [Closterium sp. Naga37s-1]|nr:unnamed protein product [Closterium sp. Naga37s-1]
MVIAGASEPTPELVAAWSAAAAEPPAEPERVTMATKPPLPPAPKPSTTASERTPPHASADPLAAQGAGSSAPAAVLSAPPAAPGPQAPLVKLSASASAGGDADPPAPVHGAPAAPPVSVPVVPAPAFASSPKAASATTNGLAPLIAPSAVCQSAPVVTPHWDGGMRAWHARAHWDGAVRGRGFLPHGSWSLTTTIAPLPCPPLHTLQSGLDDYPRASHPSEDERHVDLRCWLATAAAAIAKIGSVVGEDVQVRREAVQEYEATAQQLTDFTRLNEKLAAQHPPHSAPHYLSPTHTLLVPFRPSPIHPPSLRLPHFSVPCSCPPPPDGQSPCPRHQLHWDGRRQRYADYGNHTDKVSGGTHGRRGAVHGRRGAVHGRRGVVHGRRGAVHGRRGVVHGRRGAVHGRRGAVHGRRGAVHGRRGAVHGRRGVVYGRRGVVYGRRGVMHGRRGVVYGRRGVVYGRRGVMHGKAALNGERSGGEVKGGQEVRLEAVEAVDPVTYSVRREQRRVVKGSPTLRFVPHFGYVSLFPLLLRLIPPHASELGQQLEALREEKLLWTPFGLRSLATTRCHTPSPPPGDTLPRRHQVTHSLATTR